jgi:tetratricopeptide (TPR) repeat protein
MANRIEAILGMLEASPTDSRLRYMLANEYKNAGQLETAVEHYRKILESDAAYGPAYYHGGQTLEQLGRRDEARGMYAEGIEATARSGDSHTRGELQAALESISY